MLPPCMTPSCACLLWNQPGDWVQCSEMWGVSTFYKLNVDKTLTIKMTGPSQGSVFNQVHSTT